jgi:hypothetical protein
MIVKARTSTYHNMTLCVHQLMTAGGGICFGVGMLLYMCEDRG